MYHLATLRQGQTHAEKNMPQQYVNCIYLLSDRTVPVGLLPFGLRYMNLGLLRAVLRASRKLKRKDISA
jgi:hypothetical protein